MRRNSLSVLVVGLLILNGCSSSERPHDAGPSDDGKRDAGDKLPTTRVFSREQYVADLTFIARERVPGSSHWQAVQDLCAERLDTLGYEVQRMSYGSGTNVIGTRTGSQTPSELVIVGAHYDHLAGCSGADDNATGVSGALEVARLLQGREYPRTLVIACWDEEERGLIGSDHHAADIAQAGTAVALAVSLEMIGYASDRPGTQMIPGGFELAFPKQVATVKANGLRGDFITVIGNTSSASSMAVFETSATEHGLRSVVLEATEAYAGVIATLVRSDHASFWSRKMPGIMITDSANYRNPAYHCQSGDDRVEALDHNFAGKVISATVVTLEGALQHP